MIPGEIIVADGDIILNEGRDIIRRHVPDLPILRHHILNNNFTHIDIFVEINHIAAHEEYVQVLIIKGHTGYQRVLLVSQINFPVCTNPGKLVVYPDTEAAIFALHMIFLADMGKKEVPDIVMLIEADEKFAVSNRYVSWHLYIPSEE